MAKYEALFMVRPDMAENDSKTLLQHITDAVTKNGGEIISAGPWAERRKLYFPIKKFREAVYYLVEFTMDSTVVNKIKAQYRLNEDILRSMIIRLG